MSLEGNAIDASATGMPTWLSRAFFLALLPIASACSLIVDPVLDLQLTHRPLFEALGTFGGRPVPVLAEGLHLEGNESITIAFGDAMEAVCEGTCLADPQNELCCADPHVAAGGRFGLAIRLPQVEPQRGTTTLAIEVRRDGRVIGRGESDVALLPELAAAEFGQDVEVLGDGILRYSKVTVPIGHSIHLEGIPAARVRVTGTLEMGRGTPNKQAGTIQTLTGSCSSCPLGQPASLYPLQGAGPGGDAANGAGAMAVNVEGPLVVVASDEPSGNPIFIAYGNPSQEGGAVVVSIHGSAVGGSVAINTDDDDVGTGTARVMLPLGIGFVAITGTIFRGPRLGVDPQGDPDGYLPPLTDEELHFVPVGADPDDGYVYVVESQGQHVHLAPNNGQLEIPLTPGLNRVCALVADIDPIPDELFEEGQCFESIYLPR